MAQNKTTYTNQAVTDFIESFAQNESKKADSYALISLMQSISGCEPKMWGPSIVGFGNYHYKYESGHSGDAPLIGFSPRKAAISLYVFSGLEEHLPWLDNLGKFKMGKACLYVNKLSDINIDVLQSLMTKSINFLKERYPNE